MKRQMLLVYMNVQLRIFVSINLRQEYILIGIKDTELS